MVEWKQNQTTAQVSLGNFEGGQAVNRVLRLLTALATVIFTAGCSAAIPSPSPTVTQSPSQSPIIEAMTPAEAKAAYKVIAQTSCDAAQALGVVESSEDYTVVSVNKAEGYKDYSAAYLEKPETYKLIWELTSITSCADWFSFSMAEEAGKEAEIDVTFDAADSTFTTFEDFGEFGTSNFKYTVENGKLATSENLDPKNPIVTAIKYGNLTEADLNILKTAVDQFLAAD